MNMIKLFIVVFWSLGLAAIDTCNAASSAEVEAAIEKTKSFIYSRQKPDGTWEISGPSAKHNGAVSQWGGNTAIATYALLASGDSPGTLG